MDTFEFIDKHIPQRQIPYIRLITIYTNDGRANQLCITRYNDKKIAKKAAKVGLNEDKKMIDLPPTPLKNPEPYNIQEGDYYLNYYFNTRELLIYKM